jgi:hypothetical protein
VDVLRVDPEAESRLPGEVSRGLAVALGLRRRVGKSVLAVVDERSVTADGDVMQIVPVIVNDQSDPRVAADVGHPTTVPVSVESEVILPKHVVDHDLAGRAIRPEAGQHRTPRRGEEWAHLVEQTPAVVHRMK